MAAIVGIIVGLVLGLTGAGGSVFAVPLFIYVLGIGTQQAMGLSLGIVGLSACFGILARLGSREILWIPGLIFAFIGSLTAPLGIYLNQRSNEHYLLMGFSMIVLIVALRMFNKSKGASSELDSSEILINLNSKNIMAIVLIAALTGVLSGLFGVGGGFLIVPALVMVLGIRIKNAVATSLLIISIVSASGFLSFISSLNGTNDLGLFLNLAAGGLVGMLAGTSLSRFLKGSQLEKIFAILMILMAVIIMGKTLLNSGFIV